MYLVICVFSFQLVLDVGVRPLSWYLTMVHVCCMLRMRMSSILRYMFYNVQEESVDGDSDEGDN